MRWILAGVLGLVVCGAESANAERPVCDCRFESSTGVTAFGTRAACSVYKSKDVKKGHQTCEIAFSGVGHDADALTAMKIDASSYRQRVYRLTQLHIDALLRRDIGALSDPGFLAEAIPVFARATYLRRGVAPSESLTTFDQQLPAIAKEFGGLISEIFLGKSPSTERKWRDFGNLAISPGVVWFQWAEHVVTLVFFDPREMRDGK